jgi:hypothetical protein
MASRDSVSKLGEFSSRFDKIQEQVTAACRHQSGNGDRSFVSPGGYGKRCVNSVRNAWLWTRNRSAWECV